MKNQLNKILLTVAFVTISTLAVFPCGVPQPIYGRVVRSVGSSAFPLPVYGARLELRSVGSSEIEQTVRTNPFGWYRFEPVLPCASYEVRVSHKWFDFSMAVIEPLNFPNTPEGVRVDFAAKSKVVKL